MTKNIKILLIAVLLGFLFGWGIMILGETLEYVFFWKEMTQNPRVLVSQTYQQVLEQKLRNLKPIKDWQAEDLEIEAKSVISVFLNYGGKENVLFEKNAGQKLPIASLAKLMTANIVFKNYDLSQKVRISKEAIDQEEDFGKLEAGKSFEVKYLLYPLLMESSNDAAYALANDYNGMKEEKFVELMNLEAQKLNLRNTYFINSTGLDPEEEELDLEKEDKEINYSTIIDLVKLTKELLKEPLIWEILSTPKFNLYGPELINTNNLLEEVPGIIGGKTGYTEKASGCFLLVSNAPKSKGYLINVILGSSDRFGEMKKLLTWIQRAYNW